MRRLGSGIALSICGLLVLATAAHAETRIALLITNQAYSQPGAALSNTHRDGEILKAALEKASFKVWVAKDTANEGALLRAVGDHVQRLLEAGPEAVGFFYYSGHGAADRPNGENFLIPTGVPVTHATDLPLMAVRLERITSTLATAGKMSFVVFDACRNVPLKRAEKSPFKGFVPVSEHSGLLLAFATDPGNVAIDENLYAKALAEELVKPGVEAAEVFRGVRQRVRADTKQKQSPEYVDRRDYGFQFVAAAAQQSDAEIKLLKEQLAKLQNDLKQQQERMGSNSDREKALQDALAKSQAELKKREEEQQKQVAVAAPPPPKKPVFEAMPAFDAVPAPPPGLVFRDSPGCPEMVVMPVGSFMMGSPESEERRTYREGPQRKVTIARPFAVGKFEVTFAEWDACVAAGGCKHTPNDRGWGRGKRPVINVSWDDVTKEYLPWLSRKTGKTYRLLTEAEWEYAARAGTTTPYSTGRTITAEQANFLGEITYGGSAKGLDRGKTVEVGSFKANAFGLHDMHGNVWEWVEDCLHDSYQGAPTDGSAWTTSCNEIGRRVLRGGAWSTLLDGLRSANHGWDSVGTRGDVSGFRVARTLVP